MADSRGPAQLLEAAAELIEFMLAELSQRDVRWGCSEIDAPYESRIEYDDETHAAVADVLQGSGAGGYMELMNPLVGAALARFLRNEAEVAGEIFAGMPGDDLINPAVFDLSRAILGEEDNHD